MAQAGNYLFISFHHRGGNVTCHVHQTSTGQLVDTLVPEGLGGIDKVGDSDVPYAIRAYQRKEGDYLIFLEENRNAKNILFRWHPTDDNVRLDDEWSHKLSTIDRIVVKLLCGREQDLYGY